MIFVDRKRQRLPEREGNRHAAFVLKANIIGDFFLCRQVEWKNKIPVRDITLMKRNRIAHLFFSSECPAATFIHLNDIDERIADFHQPCGGVRRLILRGKTHPVRRRRKSEIGDIVSAANKRRR